MNKIRKHISDIDKYNEVKDEESEFSTLEELMKIEFIKQTTNWFDKTFTDVYIKQYSIYQDYEDRYSLMCEYIENGISRFYVVGFLDNLEGVETLMKLDMSQYDLERK
jgi:hypothetical protein